MDNIFAQIKTTELKGSTFRSRILDFGDFDISGAEFKIVFKRAGNILSFPDLIPQKVGNTLVIPYNILESYSGDIRMEAWMTLNGITDLAMVDTMLISAENQLKSDAINQNVSVTFGDVVIPVTFTQAIVNIGSGNGTGENGKSAYEIAVLNGFTGTETEWLISLKGADGKDFKYEDFTPAQIESLKGADFKFEDFTEDELADLRLTFEKLTPEQKEELKGLDGSKWTEDATFEAYSTYSIRKILGYYGGTGSIPSELTANIGKYNSKAGGYTTVKADATPFTAGASDISDKISYKISQSEINGVEIPLINGYIISSSGLLTARSEGIVTEKIPVTGSKIILKAESMGSPYVRGFVFYDTNGNKIKPLRPNRVPCGIYMIEYNDGTKCIIDGEIGVPSDAVSFQFTIQANTIANIENFKITQYNYELPDTIRDNNKFAPYNQINKFTVKINTVNPLSVAGNGLLNVLDSETLYDDWCVLMLPDNYDPLGTPTKLVIGCHGGGGTVTSSGSQVEAYEIYQYLASKGYAIMDVAGMPNEWRIEKQIDHNRVMGSYFSVSSYQKAYDFIVRKWNIDRNGVYLTGGSNGGITSNNIYAHSNIPIKCMAGLSPLVSMDNAWALQSGASSGGKFSKYQNRANIIAIYGMSPVSTQAQLDTAVIEPDKIKGFDPIKYNTFEVSGVKYKIHTVPYKIWHPIDDPLVQIEKSREFVNSIKNAGGYAVLREMESGGHGPEGAGSVVGTFEWNGVIKNVYPAMDELLKWFNRF